MRNKILITGSAGFIGFHLVEKLAKNSNWDITGLDNINNYYSVALKLGRLKESGISTKRIKYNKLIKSVKNKNYSFIKLDLMDKENLSKLFEEIGFNYVVNLAAQAGVRYSLENPQAYIDSNITGFLNILECCHSYPVKHLIFASSSSVYGGNKKIPFKETDRVDNPISLYAATKKSNELMAHTYSHLFGIPTTGLRFFTVYGPWGRPDMAYYKFVDAIEKGKPIEIFNYGEMERDFTYIDDVIEAIDKLLSTFSKSNDKKILNRKMCEKVPSNIYNIGHHKPIKLAEMIEIIEYNLGKKAIKIEVGMQPGDVERTYADISKISKVINFVPSVDFAYGIKEFIKWYKNFSHD